MNAKSYWLKKWFVFASGFYIILMTYKFIVEQEDFTWKKPLGNLLLALLIGYAWSEGMKAWSGKGTKKVEEFIWWKFALVTTAGTLLLTLTMNLIFMNAFHLQTLFIALATAFGSASLFGIFMQFAIFNRHQE